MTVDAFKLDDRQILDVLATARREGALVLVHAESHDVIGWLSDRLLQADRRAPSITPWRGRPWPSARPRIGPSRSPRSPKRRS